MFVIQLKYTKINLRGVVIIKSVKGAILILLNFLAFIFLLYFVSGEYVISGMILVLSLIGLNTALRNENKLDKYKYYKIVMIFLIVCIILRYICLNF